MVYTDDCRKKQFLSQMDNNKEDKKTIFTKPKERKERRNVDEDSKFQIMGTLQPRE